MRQAGRAQGRAPLHRTWRRLRVAVRSRGAVGARSSGCASALRRRARPRPRGLTLLCMPRRTASIPRCQPHPRRACPSRLLLGRAPRAPQARRRTLLMQARHRALRAQQQARGASAPAWPRPLGRRSVQRRRAARLSLVSRARGATAVGARSLCPSTSRAWSQESALLRALQGRRFANQRPLLHSRHRAWSLATKDRNLITGLAGAMDSWAWTRALGTPPQASSLGFSRGRTTTRWTNRSSLELDYQGSTCVDLSMYELCWGSHDHSCAPPRWCNPEPNGSSAARR
mmetsp:Transcript_22897/g.71664  ORF Transcript_22897/g.71664 Transcript_22897/m.71664 type:complete len:286 (+) Transcript_22897:56-913(+)